MVRMLFPRDCEVYRSEATPTRSAPMKGPDGDARSASEVCDDDVRTPAQMCHWLSCGSSSPGDDRDDNEGAPTNGPLSARTTTAVPRTFYQYCCGGGGGNMPLSPEPARRLRTITAAEAYHRGMLVSYLLSAAYELNCCPNGGGGGTTTAEELEGRWSGHQPLVPDTWSRSDGSLSTHELRNMRLRRRRGLVAPSTLPSPVEDGWRDTGSTSINKGIGKFASSRFSAQCVREGVWTDAARSSPAMETRHISKHSILPKNDGVGRGGAVFDRTLT